MLSVITKLPSRVLLPLLSLYRLHSSKALESGGGSPRKSSSRPGHFAARSHYLALGVACTTGTK